MSVNINQLLSNRENFVAINDFDKYEISTLGRVRNVSTGRILKSIKNGDGYLQVGLNKHGKKHTKKIHRLIAEAFIQNPNNYEIVDHQDRNRTNNSIDNIRWVSRQINNINIKKPKSNISGIVGVNLHDNRWVAQWRDANGKTGQKSFSCNKYPDAKERATTYRNEMINSLPHYKFALNL